MPAVDSTALTALGNTVVAPAYFGWLDFVGDPLRATTYGANVTFSGTGDTDLDGHTFEAFDPQFIDVGDVSNQQGGSETMTVSLSGILSIDTALLNIIGDRSKWYRRAFRLWMRVYDENNTAQGAVIPYYTGYMVDVRLDPTPESQTIEVQAENYLNILRDASHRTYLDQALFDSGDLSAQASIAAANGAKTGPASAVGGGYGGGSASSNRPLSDRFDVRPL